MALLRAIHFIMYLFRLRWAVESDMPSSEKLLRSLFYMTER